MGFENASTIAQLNVEFPENTDELKQIDDHIRMIKKVLQETFKNGEGEDSLGWNNRLSTPLKVLNGYYDTISANEEGLLAVGEADNTVNKVFEIGEAGKVTVKEIKTPIGSLIPSLLTQSEMDVLYGTNTYVLCDGRNIQTATQTNSTASNSRYFTLTGLTAVPDLLSKQLLTRQSLNSSRNVAEGLTRGTGKAENDNLLGSIRAYGGDTDNEAYRSANGDLLEFDVEGNEILAQVIGTRWGSDSTSFNYRVPNVQGIFLRNRSAGATTDPDRNIREALYDGGAIGNSVGSYQADNFPSHNHTYLRNNGFGVENNPFGGSKVSTDRSSVITRATDSSGSGDTRPKNALAKFEVKKASEFFSTGTERTDQINKYLAVNYFVRIN